jgi:hypothetical protein
MLGLARPSKRWIFSVVRRSPVPEGGLGVRERSDGTLGAGEGWVKSTTSLEDKLDGGRKNGAWRRRLAGVGVLTLGDKNDGGSGVGETTSDGTLLGVGGGGVKPLNCELDMTNRWGGGKRARPVIGYNQSQIGD